MFERFTDRARRVLALLEDPSFWTPFIAVVCITARRG
jgi:hypothetical protein